ncbi:MAG: PEP/pyruvate-binding domain-containing protein [Patescibacteria group bacterium]
MTFSRRADLSGLSDGITKKSSAKSVDWNAWRNVFRRVESVFGRPQDIEWGIAEDGSPFVFQSRPITTLGASDVALIREFDRYETENASA